mmetsp:Transcript_3905/g.24710  ORF Transcript_3905/g.24710 Transcript_3905/m.24710 type:complete len:213 (-) Transcript_3905:866-1504(-)
MDASEHKRGRGRPAVPRGGRWIRSEDPRGRAVQQNAAEHAERSALESARPLPVQRDRHDQARVAQLLHGSPLHAHVRTLWHRSLGSNGKSQARHCLQQRRTDGNHPAPKDGLPRGTLSICLRTSHAGAHFRSVSCCTHGVPGQGARPAAFFSRGVWGSNQSGNRGSGKGSRSMRHPIQVDAASSFRAHGTCSVDALARSSSRRWSRGARQDF